MKKKGGERARPFAHSRKKKRLTGRRRKGGSLSAFFLFSCKKKQQVEKFRVERGKKEGREALNTVANQYAREKREEGGEREKNH